MAAPKLRTVDQIKKAILRPALTSHYEVFISPPSGDFLTYIANNNVKWGIEDQSNIFMACSDALLPGSNFATSEINGDYTGVTERHAHRRVYDDRIDLSFYVQNDGRNPYNAIKFFEAWTKFMTNESIAGGDNNNSVASGHFYYQIKYPNEYYGGLEITKFERDNYSELLTYKFVNVFPISISSMPISYESANLLKVTVSFSYIRYYITSMKGLERGTGAANITTLSPEQAAAINNQTFNPNFNTGLNYGNYSTTGGVTIPQSSSSGNAFNINPDFGRSFTLNK
jgi:hypothetical protein